MVRYTSGTPILAHFFPFFAFNSQKVPQILMYSWFFQNKKNGQKSIFSLKIEKKIWHTLIIWGNTNFSFRTLFMRISQTWLVTLLLQFFGAPFLQFLAQKCKKYKFSWKNPFLRFFLWVISVRKGFLYFSRKLILESSRAIFLRTVRNQASRI